MMRDDRIAIVGMACRFPQAPDVDAFWRLLDEGRNSFRAVDEDALRASGLAESVWRGPSYVATTSSLDDPLAFDAEFFGMSPRHARDVDPQQRVFLEVALEALENAALDPATFAGAVGVFAGEGAVRHGLEAMQRAVVDADMIHVLQETLNVDKDFLTSRLAYKLGLRGPAVTVQTACSTSLVAVHMACRSLLDGESDACMAGGVTVHLPHGLGYAFTEGGTFAPDGVCRPFDAGGKGIVPASGCGVVVLRRLADAIADRHTVLAVIRGSAMNNDGAGKLAFAAPAARGQADVMRRALRDTDPRLIGMVEAHGTGTTLGDAIELEALDDIYASQAPNMCALGSVKGNVGHLDTASGIAGLLKAVLCVKHGRIVPTLNVREPNSALTKPSSPFYLPQRSAAWPEHFDRRRAAVSSFGMGGTNCHVVIENHITEDHAVAEPAGSIVLPLSARTPKALDSAKERLATFLRAHPELALRDVATTLRMGRTAHGVRWVAAANDIDELVIELLQRETVHPLHQIHDGILLVLATDASTMDASHALAYFDRALPVMQGALAIDAVLLPASLLPIAFALSGLMTRDDLEAFFNGDAIVRESMAQRLRGRALPRPLVVLPEGEAFEYVPDRWTDLARTGPAEGVDALIAAARGMHLPIIATGLANWIVDMPATGVKRYAGLEEAIAHLWAHGCAVHWDAMASTRSGQRIPLPTYPFLHVGQDTPAADPVRPPGMIRSNPGALPMLRTWLPMAVCRVDHAALEADIWLLAGDNDTLIDMLERHLRLAGALSYRWTLPDSAAQLVTRIKTDTTQTLRLRVLHCIDDTAASAPAPWLSAIAELERCLPGHIARQVVLAAGMFALNGKTRLRETAGWPAAAWSLSRELGNADLLMMDVPRDRAGQASAVAAIVDGALQADPCAETIAVRGVWYRGDWMVAEASGQVAVGDALPAGAICLIAGGTGRLGMALAQILHDTCRARILLLARHGPTSDVSSSRHALWRQITALREQGMQIDVLEADASDTAAVASTLAARDDITNIDAVFHLAAAIDHPSAFKPTLALDAADYAVQSRPKVQALLALDHVLGPYRPSFAVAISSVSSITGGTGMGAYGAANAIMEAVVEEGARSLALPWVCVALGPVDMAGGEADAMSAAEAMRCTTSVVSWRGVSHLLIGREAPKRPTARQVSHLSGESSVGTTVPEGAADAGAPRGDLDRLVLGIFARAVGTSTIRMTDTWLALGVDSLILMDIIEEIARTFNVRLSLRELMLGESSIATFSDSVALELAARLDHGEAANA